MWIISEKNAEGEQRPRTFYLPCGEYTVGRKDSHLTFTSDRSVSRSHATLKVEPPAEGTASIPGTQDVSFGFSLLRLTDRGSKFKTYINGHEIVPHTPMELKPNDEVQFGGAGSIVRVQPFELRLCLSRVLKTCKKTGQQCGSCKKCIYELSSKLGGQMVNDWDANCTHLVMAKEMIATTKVIFAVIYGKPVVKPVWLSEMLTRPEISDPLPDEKKFCPPVASPLIKDFGVPRRDFLASFVFLSMVKDPEGESLVEAAGAFFVPLYDLDKQTFVEKNWAEDYVGKTVMILDLPGKDSDKPRTQHLLSLGICTTDKTKVAEAIISLDTQLLSQQGAVPPPGVSAAPQAGTQVSQSHSINQVSQALIAQGKSASLNINKKRSLPMEPRRPAVPTNKPAKQRTPPPQAKELEPEIKPKLQSEAKKEEQEKLLNHQQTPRKEAFGNFDSSSKIDRQKNSEKANGCKSSSKKNVQIELPHSSKKRKLAIDGNVSDQEMVDKKKLKFDAKETSTKISVPLENKKKPQNCTSVTKATTPSPTKELEWGTRHDQSTSPKPQKQQKPKNRRFGDSMKDDLDQIPSSRLTALSPVRKPQNIANQLLEDDGWITKLPEGAQLTKLAQMKEKKREEILAAEPKIFKAEEEEPPVYNQPVVEERSLVVVRNENASRLNASHGASSRNSKLPNFKRFRKNQVLYGNEDLDEFVPLRSLQATLPKESERELQLLEEQRALEEQQAAAEDLFQETTGRAKISSRRGGSTTQTQRSQRSQRSQGGGRFKRR